MSLSHKKKIVVVAHDAGGAENLAAYVLENQKRFTFICFADGPAARIMKRDRISFTKASERLFTIEKILKRNSDADIVLTGTGWMTHIERNFILSAKKLGLQTAAFLDHWVNFRERFGFPHAGWKNDLPDEIWVGDKPAQKIAVKYFGKDRVRFVANPYFKRTRQYFKHATPLKSTRTILFLSEPNAFSEEVFRAVLEDLSARKFKDLLVVRLHPAEQSGKYDTLIKQYQNRLHITQSKERDLWRDLSRARLVIGIETMALAVASLGGKKVISFIPKKGGMCPLPLEEIVKVRSVVGLKRTLNVMLRSY